jgi:HEAT repeat protein
MWIADSTKPSNRIHYARTIMIRLLAPLFVVTLLALSHVAPVFAADSVAELIEKLASDQAQDVRVAAAAALQEKALKTRERETVVSILSTWLKDKDPEVRKTASASLACAMIGTKGKCPLEVVQAMFDDNPNVRLHAAIGVSECRQFPPEAVLLLLRAIEYDDRDVRTNIPMLLADVAKDDERTLPALKKATTDKDPSVQSNAMTALFKLTHDFDLVVPIHLRRLEDFRAVLGTIQEADFDREYEKRQLGVPAFFAMISEKFLVEYGETEPDKLGRSLIKLLSDKSPPIRQAAVRALGEIAERKEQSRKALLRIDAHLAVEKLTDDPERMIRGAALTALDQLSDPK